MHIWVVENLKSQLFYKPFISQQQSKVIDACLLLVVSLTVLKAIFSQVFTEDEVQYSNKTDNVLSTFFKAFQYSFHPVEYLMDK